MIKSIGIVGAGPKAVALVAKAATLKSLGYESVPRLVAFDRYDVAGNWTGEHGFTSGRLRLGTPPEKDVGYPYSSSLFDSRVPARVFAEFSWQAYLVGERGNYGDWVDRGRPHPKHSEWADYLRWVFVKADGDLTRASVNSIGATNGKWELSADGQVHLLDAIVVTGPGEPKGLPAPNCVRILDGRSFWSHLDDVESIVREAGDLPICVVGSGETAATIVTQLTAFTSEVPILVINRQGTIFSRGEGYHENRLFTDPGDSWQELDLTARREVIGRADRGVFSLDTVAVVDHAQNVRHLNLEVTSVEGSDTAVKLNGEKGSTKTTIEAAIAIIALGFDPWWFVKLFSEDLAKHFSDRSSLQNGIRPDLTLPIPDLPLLYTPMLASIAQGPGFPNLSCLGTLSDRILRPYCEKSSE